MNVNRNQGFTLAEILIVLTIVGFVMIGISKLLLDTATTSFITAEKLDINADVRQFTLEMAENARAANAFFIYDSFKPSDRDQKADRLFGGASGDFLLLIYLESWPNVNSPEHITRLVGYFRKADGNSEGPVMRFEKFYHDPAVGALPGSSGPYVSTADKDVEELLDDLTFNGDYRQVVQLSRGLSDGQLFNNFKNKSILVKAEIIHGNAAKRITDTYNYTVSPRG